jgi:hypothetical protein
MMMARQSRTRRDRRWLYALLLGVALMMTGFSAAGYWAKEIAQFTFVPAKRFVAPRRLSIESYAQAGMWFASGADGGEAARWQPQGAPAPAPMRAAVFFIHPTSDFDRRNWNARIDDPAASARAEIFLRGLATPFAGAQELWAPRYRQATFGAFLTDQAEGKAALDAAYRDVLAAFDHFVVMADPSLPIILAGHSQGGYHLVRLLRDRVAGRPVARRLVAAYVVGWPVSLAHDLPQMGLPACHGPDQTGCIVGWQSFAEPADPATVREAYARLGTLDGAAGDGAPYLCTNPITGAPHSDAPASANLGTLVPNMALNGGTVMPGLVPARCSPDGFLLIGRGPQMGGMVLPGNNYHIYDIPLFWANLRQDAQRRTLLWKPS